MKFSELKSKVGNLGFHAYATDFSTVISNKLDTIYTIDNNMLGMISFYGDAVYVEQDDLLKLQKLAYKYSRTPLDEREDELKFLVKMLPENNDYFNSYLYSDPDGIAIVNDSGTIFTTSEYDKLQQKYPEWLPKFDKDDPHFEFVEDD